ncbi:strictosidine synthase [Aureococcus anophagefferens]|nr:strictosidine synthase [Aureococcus anophagefferens]
MPPPYDGVAASAVSAADLDLYPGQPGGTPIPPVLEGAWAPNDRLRAATRLFEGDGARGFYDTMQGYLMNLMRGDHSGRLLKYDALDGATTTPRRAQQTLNGRRARPTRPSPSSPRRTARG